MKKRRLTFNPVNLLMIALGTAIYSFGFVEFNMGNDLAEGGVSGITLIAHALLGINPAYTQLLLNIPLFFLGYKYLGKSSLAYTIYATFCMSFFIYLFQKLSIQIDIGGDFLIAAILAGTFAGIGTGIIFRFGGTSGGSDIVAKVFEEKRGIQLGQALLLIDVLVLLASLSYIDIKHMMYTLIASFVFSNVVDLVQSGGYTVRGMIIITDKATEAGPRIMEEIERGATYLNGEGVYSGLDKKILYIVLSPQEIVEVKKIMAQIDPNAFISIINVHEVVGSGFSYEVKKKKIF
ncbi:YitT family protein [Streptococcaceae bacterium ESL0687]|nr:YitT family protein [Streptococcaceae bacterium ESL0687]